MDIHIHGHKVAFALIAIGISMFLSGLLHFVAPDWKIFIYGVWSGMAATVVIIIVNQYLHRSF